jgi:hypothetical protein
MNNQMAQSAWELNLISHNSHPFSNYTGLLLVGTSSDIPGNSQIEIDNKIAEF